MKVAPQAVLFDLDGVLCELWKFAQILESRHGISRDHTREFFVSNFPKALRGESSVTDLLVPFLPQWGFPGTPEQFLSLWLESERGVRPELLSLVSELRLRGYRCGLATNQERNRGRYLRDEMGLAEVFDEIFVSAELGAAKPEADFFYRIQSALGVSPELILFIDDEERYCLAAEKAGWCSYRFQDPKESVEELRALLLR